jgi:hypothetical protein
MPLLVTFLLVASVAQEQSTSTKGSVTGAVLSPAGEPLVGVVVVLSTGADEESMLQVSGPSGEFAFADLAPGTYSVLATLPGYEDEFVDEVQVEPGEETHLELSLQLARFSESVMIRDVTPVAGGVAPAPPAQIGIEKLELLPLATDRFQDAFPLLPGVVRDPEGRLSFNGSRPSQSILLVNGANVTDPVTGDFAVELPLNAVEEVEVNEIPYSAEYGRVTAAVAEVKTRGGTDEWDLDTGDLFPKINFRDGKIRGIRAFVPQIGVSGPIKKGRAWFSQGLAYRFVRTRAYDLPYGDDERILESYDSFTQFDWRVSDRHDLTTTFSYFPGEVDNLGLNAVTTAEATPEFHSSGWNVAVSERSMFGSNLLETTLAFKRYSSSITPKSNGAARLTPEGLRGNYFNEIDRVSHRFELMSALTRSVPDFHGEHVLKIGGHVGRSKFDGIDSNLPIEIEDANGRLLRRIDFSGEPSVEGTDIQVSAFVQDRWRVSGRLGLEAGLRYDYDQLVAEHQLAPRLAFAYALDAAGRTVARGGVGIFYDHVYLHLAGFERFQDRVETSFDEQGDPIGTPIVFRHRYSDADIDTPRSTTWNVELDRVLAPWLEARLDYRERRGSQELIVDRLVENGEGSLVLSSAGSSLARELGVTFRLSTKRGSELFIAYAKSRSTGDLNNFGTLYQNLRSPLILDNENSLFELDVPHRFLLWGLWKLPWDLQLAPGLEWRSGFPFSVFDESYVPVGSRNRGGRFLSFFSFDFRLTRGVTVKGRRIRLGVQFYNLGDHFNPRDVISNVASPRFGEFLNGVDMGVSFRFSLGGGSP